MTPDAPSKAMAAMTLPMIFLPLVYHSSPLPEAAIITPATMIAMKDARRITVTSILVNHSIRRGNAVFSETANTSGLAAAFAPSALSSASESM